MTNTADRVTRIAADLMDSAAAEGARQSRSAKQQLDHWARVGRAVDLYLFPSNIVFLLEAPGRSESRCQC